MISKIQIPDVFEGLLEPHPIKAFYGGRGGGKSTSFALALLVIGMKEKKRILCTIKGFKKIIAIIKESEIEDRLILEIL